MSNEAGRLPRENWIVDAIRPLARKIELLNPSVKELTEDQIQALSQPHLNPPQLINPRTHEAFVLLRVSQYKKLTEELYDDGPWSCEELQSIARASNQIVNIISLTMAWKDDARS